MAARVKKFSRRKFLATQRHIARTTPTGGTTVTEVVPMISFGPLAFGKKKVKTVTKARGAGGVTQKTTTVRKKRKST